MNPLDPNSLVGSIFMGWVRHAVTAFGAGLVTNGYLSAAQDQQVVGAILVIIPIALSGYQKYSAKAKANAAILAAAQKGTNNAS